MGISRSKVGVKIPRKLLDEHVSTIVLRRFQTHHVARYSGGLRGAERAEAQDPAKFRSPTNMCFYQLSSY